MAFIEPLYKYDIATLKKYGSNYKLSLHNCIRTSGLECDIKRSKKGTVNNHKLANNISRAKNKVFEYAICNDWKYFATLTIDKDKFNRYQLKDFYKSFGIFIQNINRDYSCKIAYLIIPEQHKDGAWHLHGLFNDLPLELLKSFTKDMHLPYYILNKLNSNEEIFYFEKYSNKFGFCYLEPIKDIERTAKYITKYITKDLQNSIEELGGHLYYCSKNLNVANEVCRGQISMPINEPDFENEYVKIKWFNSAEEGLKFFDKGGDFSA